MTVSRPFSLLFLQIFSHGLSSSESLQFVLYAWSSYFALILKCLNITKLLKLKMTARPPF